MLLVLLLVLMLGMVFVLKLVVVVLRAGGDGSEIGCGTSSCWWCA